MASKLKNKDVLSKSDPQVVVFMKKRPAQYSPQIQSVHAMPWVEIARTEIVKDDLNPNFATPIVLDYFFEEVQPIKY